MDNGIMAEANPFFDNVARTIEEGRRVAGHAVDITMCATYYEVGRQIVEEEQGGKAQDNWAARRSSRPSGG